MNYYTNNRGTAYRIRRNKFNTGYEVWSGQRRWFNGSLSDCEAYLQSIADTDHYNKY